jgi:transposase
VEAIMFHVGLDIHSKHVTICILGETGQAFQRCTVRSIEQMLGVLRGLPDRFEVCYEASCGYGHYHDLLKPLAMRVLVAHPGQLRLIFRSCVVKWLMWRSAGSFGERRGSASLSAT